MITIWKVVKVVHKPTLLKNNFVLLFLRFWNHYTAVFPLNLSRILYMQWCVVFQDHVPQRCEVYNLLIFIIQSYTLHFAFSCAFSCLGLKYRKCIVFGATRYKLFDVGARTKLLQLFCQVAQIIPCFNFWGFIHILKVDNRVSIAVQDRLS